LKHYRSHVLVLVALLIVLLTGWHSALRNALIDLRFSWEPRQASGEIVVVAIDAPSIEKIGVWPWPRRLHGELLKQLGKAGVSDVLFDVDFSTPSDAASDQSFVEALRRAGGSVVLPSFKQPAADGRTHFNRPLKQFRDNAWSAIVNVDIEHDGLVRRYPFGQQLDGEFLASMGAILAGQFDSKRAAFLIDYGIRSTSIPRVSYIDVLNGDLATLGRLKDKKVIIGGTALELGDRFSTPNGGIVSGPVLQALAAESILANRALHWSSEMTSLIGVGILALAMMLSWRHLSTGRRVAALAAAALAVEAFAYLLQATYPLALDTSLFHIAAAVYIAAIALDEIDIRDLLGRVAESRFQRIAMSLGDGLICTDSNYLITEWNPGATAIFGHPAEEMIGRAFDSICAQDEKTATPTFSIRDVTELPAGRVVEFDGRRSDGEVFPVEASFSHWQDAEGKPQHGVLLRDISVRKREAERIRYLAEHDSLTGLANRNKLQTTLDGLITWAGQSRSVVALLVLGLDRFHQINDMLGHATGDLVLRAVADRLKQEIGSAGMVARLTGDEFAVAIAGAEAGESVTELARRIERAFQASLITDAGQHRIKISIGAAIFPEGGRSSDELLSNAHLAFYRAKAARSGSCVVFEGSIRKDVEARVTLEAELALAVERGEFELFYQPQVHLADSGLIGAEALIRWRHPVRGLVSPADFIPVVNTSSVSERIATWVLETACRQARAWEKAGHPLRVGVNLSPSQLHSGDLAKSVADVLQSTGLTPALLELEVTEDILLLDEAQVLDTFLRIQQLGVRIVFDDFGTGYASLSYLKKFPLDGLKIDKSFVLNLVANSDDAAIVGSTVSLSKQLGLSVIAEGIENRATADLLACMGCEEGQGYFFGRPMPAVEFGRMLQQAGSTATPAEPMKSAAVA
jgi:diguanylate cyclase (GGDEF)-like protein/PAS domain S-box-containing protein